jgi:inosine-uridine nucleoside N-ribohydrolase
LCLWEVQEIFFNSKGGVVSFEKKPPKDFEFDKEYPCHSCHNIRTDQFAASIVFSTNVPIFCVGHSVTHSMWFKGEVVEEMRKLSFHKGSDPYSNDKIQESYDKEHSKVVHIVGTLLDVWLKHRCIAYGKNVDGTCPHDALTTYEALYPGKFIKYVRGFFKINKDGTTTFKYDPIHGNANISVEWNEDPNNFMEIFRGGMLNFLKN